MRKRRLLKFRSSVIGASQLPVRQNKGSPSVVMVEMAHQCEGSLSVLILKARGGQMPTIQNGAGFIRHCDWVK